MPLSAKLCLFCYDILGAYFTFLPNARAKHKLSSGIELRRVANFSFLPRHKILSGKFTRERRLERNIFFFSRQFSQIFFPSPRYNLEHLSLIECRCMNRLTTRKNKFRLVRQFGANVLLTRVDGRALLFYMLRTREISIWAHYVSEKSRQNLRRLGRIIIGRREMTLTHTLIPSLF
jgi:hypothetical protein